MPLAVLSPAVSWCPPPSLEQDVGATNRRSQRPNQRHEINLIICIHTHIYIYIYSRPHLSMVALHPGIAARRQRRAHPVHQMWSLTTPSLPFGVGLYKIFVDFEAVVHESNILTPRPPAFPTLVQYHCTTIAQYATPLPPPRVYATHYTILVRTISYKGQFGGHGASDRRTRCASEHSNIYICM